MKELYALSGKKHLALLLSYQLIFLATILFSSLTFFYSFVYTQFLSITLKIIVFTIMYSSLAFLIDGLWEALSGGIFRLNYAKAKLLHHWIFRPLLLVCVLEGVLITSRFYTFIMINNFIFIINVCIFLVCLVLIVSLNLVMLSIVILDILHGKDLYQDCLKILQSIKDKYGIVSSKRILLTMNLIHDKENGNPLPCHRGFTFVGLSSLPWHENENYPWIQNLEKNYKVIKEEALNLMDNKQTLKSYNYPGVVKGEWKSIMLIKNGKQEDTCVDCPSTMTLLKQIPGNLYFREAMFSILEPGARIKPHRDYANVFITYHLGLVIPLQCGIRVGGEERVWQEGKSLIFDTSYEHEAWNYDDKFRLILLVDFFHPELNEAEKEFLKMASYKGSYF